MAFLLIGGPWDGKWVEVEDGRAEFVVREFPARILPYGPGEAINTERYVEHVYRELPLHCGPRRWGVYRHESLTEAAAFELLLNGYGRRRRGALVLQCAEGKF